jgi:hypothetical protein
VTDVTELILGDHKRMVRLFAALDDAARYMAAGVGGGCLPDSMLATMWERIATLLGLHADAEQEICFLPMFGRRRGRLTELADAVADLNDMREAIAETRLQDPGSPAWWRAVNAARRSACDHISVIEQGSLGNFRAPSDGRFRRVLGQQWQGFIDARRRDGLFRDGEFRPPAHPRTSAAACPRFSAGGPPYA